MVFWIGSVATGGDVKEIVTLVTGSFDAFIDGGSKLINQTPAGFPPRTSAEKYKIRSYKKKGLFIGSIRPVNGLMFPICKVAGLFIPTVIFAGNAVYASANVMFG